MVQLSSEQQKFIDIAKTGKNILVDACIGSGKTTTIQALCNQAPAGKRVLYLTYNKLLKLDAQRKIQLSNVFVTNYHGFAMSMLYRNNIKVAVNKAIPTLNNSNIKMPNYDLLIIDEYQDISEEIAEMLEKIKSNNPGIQILAVGDMVQKIYDNTRLDVWDFINDFLDEHETIEFTKCFRLSKDYAKKLGDVWQKQINGVNPDCEITTMNEDDVVNFIGEHDPSEILCLGARRGTMSQALNLVESYYPDIYNKQTVYASIAEGSNTAPSTTSAIFTTFDGSKGMERDICIVFDYDASYWSARLHKPQVRYEILRNIFLVAASRGKRQIIYVTSKNAPLTDEVLSEEFQPNFQFEDTNYAGLFAFKFQEDIAETYAQLQVEETQLKDDSILELPENDALIDLEPVIESYLPAEYFKNFSLDYEITFLLQNSQKRPMSQEELDMNVNQKSLFKTYLLTRQARYMRQVSEDFIDQETIEKLNNRLSLEFDRDATDVQVQSTLDFKGEEGELFEATDFITAVKDDTPYKIVYTSEPTNEDLCEVGCQIVANGFEKGILWNLRDNRQYIVTVPDPDQFLNDVVNTATKGHIKEF